MKRTRRWAAVLAITAGLTSVSTTTGLAGGGTGTGSPPGGGISGGGGSGSGAAWDASCGTGVMAVYNSAVFPPVASGATLSPYVWPAYNPSPKTAAAMDKMVFLVDPATQLAIGPPSLYNWSGGEGFPPGVVFKGQTSLPPYKNNATFPGYAPWWNCYTGGPPTPGSQPFTTTGAPPRNNGQTATNGPAAALVLQPVVASLAKPCPLVSIAPGSAIKLPPPSAGWATYPANGSNTVDSAWPECPESEVQIGQNPSWKWLIFDQPVLTNRPSCASGSGPYEWDWTPHAFTNRANHCTNGSTDTTTFTHVLNNPPGLVVTSTVGWRDWCSGTYTDKAYGHTFTFAPSAANQTQTWVAPDGTSVTVTLNCDGPAFAQNNAATAAVPVDQIETVPNG